MGPRKKDKQEEYSEEEAQRRFEATLKRMLSTPPKPHSEMRLGKRKAKMSQEEAGNPRKKGKRTAH